MDKITVDSMDFKDHDGRVRLFYGFNIDDKAMDRQSFAYDLNEEFFEKYTARGFNIIRLAFTWQNLEPEQGKYNESYLKSIDSIFELAEKHGVYILLDMHQDLYSGFGDQSVGDGAPEWAALTDGHKVKMPKFVWAEAYIFGKWVHSAFDHFWNNDKVNGIGLQDSYAALWQMLAERYGDSPALFGFDLMNEPFPGSDSKKMILRLVRSVVSVLLFSKKISRCRIIKALVKRDIPALLGSVGGNVVRDITKRLDSLAEDFDLKKYSPFLNRVSSAIREITKNGIIMMEQSYFCNAGVKQSAPPITVNGEREPQQCFGPHGYDMTVDTPLYKHANAGRVKAFFTEMRNTQLRLGVPTIVGEWGGCSDNKDTSWFPHAWELLRFFDENLWGNIYWDYHGDDLDSPLMGLLSRPHPVAVAGKVLSYDNETENGVFRLRFDSKPDGQSVIYLNKAFEMPEGLKYETLKAYDNGASLINVFTDAGERDLEIKLVDG